MDRACDVVDEINFFDIPLTSLKITTSRKLSDMLNPERVLPNNEGCPRDWRGLQSLANLPVQLSMGEDPTMKVLQMWKGRKISSYDTSPSLGLLRKFLGQLDRWDVVDDTAKLMYGDARDFLLVSQSSQPSVKAIDNNVDNQILTRDDVSRVNCGLPAQNYDAFLLYAEEDEDFALQVINKLEAGFGLKLCVKDRDLIGGFFEHEAVMRLIAERCNRLIVILSPNFLNSEANRFFVTYAQALGIEQRQRKVIPCLYQRCQIPSQLSHCFFLDYNRSGKLFDFWGKLKDSVQSHSAVPSLPSHARSSLVETFPYRVRCTVQEVTDSSQSSSGQTALVCLSDPSTLYPPLKGVVNGDSDNDHWHPSKPSKAVSVESSSSQPTKSNSSSSFLRKLLPKDLRVDKVKRKKKWFSRKEVVALDNS